MRVWWNGKRLKTYPFCDSFGYHKFRARRGDAISKQWLDDFWFKEVPLDLLYRKFEAEGRLHELLPLSSN